MAHQLQQCKIYRFRLVTRFCKRVTKFVCALASYYAYRLYEIGLCPEHFSLNGIVAKAAIVSCNILLFA